MSLILKTIMFLCLKSVFSHEKCPFPACNSIYSLSNICNINCSKIKLINRGTSLINSIGSMILDQVSYIDDKIFSYLEISQLNFLNLLPKKMEKDAFKDLKRIGLITFKSISLNEFSILEDNFIHLKNKTETMSFLNCNLIILEQLNFLLNFSDYIEIKKLLFVQTSTSSVVDISKMTNLKSFFIGSTDTKSLILNINQNLNEISIKNSNLNMLAIKAVELGSELKNIYLFSNKLDKFEARFLNVEQLILYNNSFYYLSKENFIIENIIVSKLDLSNNKISFMEPSILKDLKKVQYLKLAHNKLDYSTSFVNLSELVELNLSWNDFSRFDQELVFGCEKLQLLDLSNNNIDIFNVSLKSLLKINLNNNRIKSIYNFKTWTINELYLDKNQIKTIDDINLEFAKNLKLLSLNYNQIKSLSFELLRSFKSLFRLELNGNYLINLEFPRLRFLKTLFLDENYFESINRSNFGNLIELEILTLAENKIRFVHSDSFVGNNNIELLDLSNNFLSDIPNVLTLPKLKKFFLNNQNGQFTQIKNYAFERQSPTIDFYLADNNITYFSPHSFCLKNSSQSSSITLILENLDFLHKCLLKQINSQVTINLHYNKIDCYLKVFIDKYKYKIYSDYSGILCSNEIFDDCSEEANLKYNCSYDLNEFETTFSWFIIGQPFFALSGQILESCLFKNGLLFEHKGLKIFLSQNFNNSHIELIEDNKSVDINKADYLNNEESDSIFEYLKLDKYTHLFHYLNSDIFIVLGSLSKKYLDYVIVFTSKFVFDKSDGYLVKGYKFLNNDSISVFEDFKVNILEYIKNIDSSTNNSFDNETILNYINKINRSINLLNTYTNDKTKKHSERSIDYFKRIIGTNYGTSKNITNFFLFYEALFFLIFCIFVL